MGLGLPTVPCCRPVTMVTGLWAYPQCCVPACYHGNKGLGLPTVLCRACRHNNGGGGCPCPQGQVWGCPALLRAGWGGPPHSPPPSHHVVFPLPQATTMSACATRATSRSACPPSSSTPRPVTTSPTATRVRGGDDDTPITRDGGAKTQGTPPQGLEGMGKGTAAPGWDLGQPQRVFVRV